MKLSFWINTKVGGEYVEIRECDEPEEVSLTIHRGADLTTVWMTQEQFRELGEVRYRVNFVENPPTNNREKSLSEPR